MWSAKDLNVKMDFSLDSRNIRKTIMGSTQSKVMMLAYAIGLVLINLDGIQMRRSAVFVVMAILGSYSVACMVKGGCTSLAWVYSLVPLIMLITGYMQRMGDMPIISEARKITSEVGKLAGSPSNMSQFETENQWY